jgi:hypothetical protein
MFVAKPIGEAAGFHFWKPLVWDKKAMGMGYHYRARYEFVLFFEKGKPKLARGGIGARPLLRFGGDRRSRDPPGTPICGSGYFRRCLYPRSFEARSGSSPLGRLRSPTSGRLARKSEIEKFPSKPGRQRPGHR